MWGVYYWHNCWGDVVHELWFSDVRWKVWVRSHLVIWTKCGVGCKKLSLCKGAMYWACFDDIWLPLQDTMASRELDKLEHLAVVDGLPLKCLKPQILLEAKNLNMGLMLFQGKASTSTRHMMRWSISSTYLLMQTYWQGTILKITKEHGLLPNIPLWRGPSL